MVTGARQSGNQKTDGVLAPSVVDSVADCLVIWWMGCTISLLSYRALILAIRVKVGDLRPMQHVQAQIV